MAGNTTNKWHLRRATQCSQLKQKNLPLVRLGSKIWNSISPDEHKLGKKDFNKTMQKSRLTILEDGDDYVDSPTVNELTAKQWTSTCML